MKRFKPFIEEKSIDLLDPSDCQKYSHLDSINEYKGKLSPCESSIITNYMLNCTVIRQWLSSRPSPFEKNEYILSQDWTDGVYYWDELIIHCINKYNIRLPTNFKEHVHQQINSNCAIKTDRAMTDNEVEAIYTEVGTSLYDTSYKVSEDYSEIFTDSIIIPVQYANLRANLYNLSVVKNETIKSDGNYELDLLVSRHILIKYLDEFDLNLSDYKYPYVKPFVY